MQGVNKITHLHASTGSCTHSASRDAIPHVNAHGFLKIYTKGAGMSPMLGRLKQLMNYV
jgi:hypothetical protein